MLRTLPVLHPDRSGDVGNGREEASLLFWLLAAVALFLSMSPFDLLAACAAINLKHLKIGDEIIKLTDTLTD